jgi:hypothetical protein
VGEWRTVALDETTQGQDEFFVPAKHQPTGKASTEVDHLRRWLKEPKNIEALINEGFSHVDSVRKELAEADLCIAQVPKATVR